VNVLRNCAKPEVKIVATPCHVEFEWERDGQCGEQEYRITVNGVEVCDKNAQKCSVSYETLARAPFKLRPG